MPHYTGVSWVRLNYHLSLSLFSRWGSWVRLTEAVICAGAHWLVKERKFEPGFDNSLAHGFSVRPSASPRTLAGRDRSSCPQHSCLSPKIHSTQEGQKTSSQREHARTSQRTRAACTVCSTSVSQALLCEAHVLGVGWGWGVEVAVRIEPGGAHSDCEVPAQLLTYVTSTEHLLCACAILSTRDSAVKKGSTVCLLQTLRSRVKWKCLWDGMLGRCLGPLTSSLHTAALVHTRSNLFHSNMTNQCPLGTFIVRSKPQTLNLTTLRYALALWAGVMDPFWVSGPKEWLPKSTECFFGPISLKATQPHSALYLWLLRLSRFGGVGVGRVEIPGVRRQRNDLSCSLSVS